MKWKGWYSVFAWIPNFSLFISTAWLNSPAEQGYTWYLWFALPYFPRTNVQKKKSGPEILEIRKSCLSAHGGSCLSAHGNWRWWRQFKNFKCAGVSMGCPGYVKVSRPSFELIGTSLDFRNRKSAFLCYYQTATNFFHSAQNARTYWILKSRWRKCLRGYE